ncbi:uncharacterized protein LOC113679561 [Pocillopora damicornis]|nr:uncharacterized protein LOC113679561 [Pocillopora damicornis]
MMRLFISLLCATVLHTFVPYEKCDASSSTRSQECFPVPNTTCAWEDRDGNIFNLAPFIRGFVANGTPHGKYDQYYSYAYNPCRWISLAGECDRDKETAICRWTPNNDNPDNYQSIGNKMPKCTKVSNFIQLTYKAGGRYLQGLKSIVKVKCDRTKVDIKDATFKVINEDYWKFELDHLCGCENACVSGTSLSLAAEEHSHIVEIVAPTAGVIVLVVLAGLFLWWRNRGNNQDDEERRPLQQDGPGQDVAHRIPDAPPENMERRPPSVALPRSKNNNHSLTI